jgi:hypothetical protein
VVNRERNLVAAMCSVVFIGFARGRLWKSVATLSSAIFNFASDDRVSNCLGSS